jgi:hypothetical protein
MSFQGGEIFEVAVAVVLSCTAEEAGTTEARALPWMSFAMLGGL